MRSVGGVEDVASEAEEEEVTFPIARCVHEKGRICFLGCSRNGGGI